MSDSSPQPQSDTDRQQAAASHSGTWVRGQDHIARVNYIFQASEEMMKLNHPLPNIAQNYGRVMATIAEKTSAKLDFTLKRSMCKKCKAVLLPGVNASYRLRRKKAPKGASKKRRGFPTQIITCKLCGTRKKFGTSPKFQLKEKAMGVIVGGSSAVQKPKQSE